jgi:Dolichyl-phosphate-mannose-protein mannosyltransferase
MKPHDIGRIVLAIAVHGGDDRKARRQHTGPERGALSGASAMPEIAKLRIFGEQRLDFRPCSIVARVIDHDHPTGVVSGTWANVSSTKGPIFPASLNAGMTTEIRIGPVSTGARQFGTDRRQAATFAATRAIVHGTPAPAPIPNPRHAANLRQGYLVRLAVCLGALLALRLAGLYTNATDLVVDEAQYWSWSRELAFGYFSKPTMIAWVMRGASAICGDGEMCLRAASPVLYTAAAFMLYLSGRALYGARIGFWSAIVFATLPGLFYSSNLITTDVPLILFWTVALYAWIMLVQRRSMGFAVFLGVAIGLGLLAKQAMGLCLSLHRLSCGGKPRSTRGAERRARRRSCVDRGRSVRAECGLERTTRPSDRQAHRDKNWLAPVPTPSAAADRISGRAVRRVRTDSDRGARALSVA